MVWIGSLTPTDRKALSINIRSLGSSSTTMIVEWYDFIFSPVEGTPFNTNHRPARESVEPGKSPMSAGGRLSRGGGAIKYSGFSIQSSVLKPAALHQSTNPLIRIARLTLGDTPAGQVRRIR